MRLLKPKFLVLGMMATGVLLVFAAMGLSSLAQPVESQSRGASDASRMVRGVVAEDGTVVAGTGFTVAKTGTGNYEVTFTTPFPSIPAVVCSGGDPAGIDDNVCDINFIAPGIVHVDTWDTGNSANLPEDSQFSFIAVGPH